MTKCCTKYVISAGEASARLCGTGEVCHAKEPSTPSTPGENPAGDGEKGSGKKASRQERRKEQDKKDEQERKKALKRGNRSGPRLKADLRAKEKGIALPRLHEIARTIRNNPVKQWQCYVEEASVPAQTGRKREAGHRTRELFRDVPLQAMRKLPKLGMGIQNVTQFGLAHFQAYIAYLESRPGTTAATFHAVWTQLHRLMVRIGKPNVPDLVDMVKDPTRVKRTYVAKKEKTVVGVNFDFEAFLARVKAADLGTWHQVRMMDAYGLRRTEALMDRPAESDGGTVLYLSRGCKGGRNREVPIDTPYKREVLDAAKEYARKFPKGELRSKVGLSKKQAIRRFKYIVAEKCGLNKAMAGMTGHGLRQGNFIALYKEKSGGYDAPVVKGGKLAPPEVHKEVCQGIAPGAGHGRWMVMNSYVGSIKMESADRRAYQKAIVEFFQQDDVASQLRAGGITRLVLLGNAAEGARPPQGSLCGWEGADPTHNPELAALITKGVDNPVLFTQLTDALFAAGPTLEIF